MNPRGDAPARAPRRLALGLLFAAAAAVAQPSPTVMQPAAIARASGHPGPLRVAPESTSELAKGFGKPVWAVGVDSADGSFGHVSVLLVHRGTFLTDALQQRLAAAAAAPAETAAAIRADLEARLEIAQGQRQRTRLQRQLAEVEAVTANNPITQRLTLPDGRVGWGTMLGFSAGGATFVTALPSPDDQYEPLVATGGSLEGQRRTPNGRSAAYERAMREHPLQVSEAMARAIYDALYPQPTPTGAHRRPTPKT